MSHGDPHHVIEILRNTEIARGSPLDYCIFRVQHHLREVNNEAYDPNIIAIGPYHSGTKKHFQLMEDHKQRYLQNLLDRKKHEKRDYIRNVEAVFEEVRKCYAEPLYDYGPDKLVLDGCFIVELMRKSSNDNLVEVHDPIFRMDWIINSLQRDLLLFENQIPFFIICMLFDMTKDEDSNETFTRLARNFFRGTILYIGRKHKDEFDDPCKFKHLLGLIHGSCLPVFTRESSHKEYQQTGWLKGIFSQTGFGNLRTLDDSLEDNAFAVRLEDLKVIPCIADLEDCGVEFKKGKGNIFDIMFVKGAIIIPPFIVEKRTESFLRNLILHEQYRNGTDHHFITDYVKLLSCLITSPRDVKHLRSLKIINNWLGEDVYVSNMFNKMTDSVIPPGQYFYYKSVFKDVEAYYQKHWQRKVIITGSSLMFLFTLIQTIFTVRG